MTFNRPRWFERTFDVGGVSGLRDGISTLRRDADEAEAYLNKQLEITITLPGALASRLLVAIAPATDKNKTGLTALETGICATLTELHALLKAAGVKP